MGHAKIELEPEIYLYLILNRLRKMPHLSSLSWIQIFLVEVGLVLLIIALRDVLAGRTAYHGHPHRRHGDSEDREEEHDSARAQKGQTNTESHHEDAHPEIRPAKLMKTSNVKFVQTFKFREHNRH
jgi:hypothetical protein